MNHFKSEIKEPGSIAYFKLSGYYSTCNSDSLFEWELTSPGVVGMLNQVPFSPINALSRHGEIG